MSWRDMEVPLEDCQWETRCADFDPVLGAMHPSTSARDHKLNDRRRRGNTTLRRCTQATNQRTQATRSGPTLETHNDSWRSGWVTDQGGLVFFGPGWLSHRNWKF